MADLLGTFEQMVLLSVVGLDDEAYGRSVLRDVQSAIEGRAITAGALYATLDRLENEGLLLSRWLKVARYEGDARDDTTG